MQKLNFLLAFFVTFFMGCAGSSDAADCGCAPTAAPAAEAPAAETAPTVAPAAEPAAVEAAPVAESVVTEAPSSTVSSAPPVVESH